MYYFLRVCTPPCVPFTRFLFPAQLCLGPNPNLIFVRAPLNKNNTMAVSPMLLTLAAILFNHPQSHAMARAITSQKTNHRQICGFFTPTSPPSTNVIYTLNTPKHHQMDTATLPEQRSRRGDIIDGGMWGHILTTCCHHAYSPPLILQISVQVMLSYCICE